MVPRAGAVVVAGVRAVSGSDMPGFLSEGGTGSGRSRNKTRELTSGHQLQDATSAPLWEPQKCWGRAGPYTFRARASPDLPGTPQGVPCCLSEELSTFLLEVKSEQDKGPSARALQPDQINTQPLTRGRAEPIGFELGLKLALSQQQ